MVRSPKVLVFSGFDVSGLAVRIGIRPRPRPLAARAKRSSAATFVGAALKQAT